MARLSTHVLDTARGRPAAGIDFILYRVTGAGDAPDRTELTSGATNAGGRTNPPLLEGEAFQPGTYELRFDAGTYLRAQGQDGPTFFDWITLRFTVADASANYHVPLLLSPWSYTTYRGS